MVDDSPDFMVSKTAGELIKEYRTRKGWTQLKLAQEIDVVERAVWGCENGRNTLSPAFIDKIARALELTPAEKKDLLFAWLPALEPTWLELQHEKMRAGLLLAAYRERAGFTQGGLAEALGIKNRTTITFWETNKQFGYLQKLPELASFLSLTSDEVKELVYARLPALNPEWLSKQPEHKQGGLLLDAYLEQAGILQSDLVKKRIFKHANAISHCVTGKRAIDENAWIAVSLILSPLERTIPFDGKYFKEVVAKSNAAIKNNGAMKRAHSTEFGAALPSGDVLELNVTQDTKLREH